MLSTLQVAVSIGYTSFQGHGVPGDERADLAAEEGHVAQSAALLLAPWLRDQSGVSSR